MTELIIDFKTTKSQILIGESYTNLHKYLPDKKIVVIADANIMKHYGSFFCSFDVIEIQANEKNKSLETVNFIYQRLLKLEVDRDCFIVIAGGGIVCDIGGFVASTYLRGVDFGFVSTTLLSQVDASVGGKNGVNFCGYKNMVGTFTQPRFVICDQLMLNTLPEKEFISGLAEVIKIAIVTDRELFEYLEANVENILSHKLQTLTYLIERSIKLKTTIVQSDERENDLRRILNFGHTFGHAIETLSGMRHGEAISVGMLMETKLSMRECNLPISHLHRILQLLSNIGLPTNTNIEFESHFDIIIKDKKRNANDIYMVIIKEIGQSIIKKIAIDDIRKYLTTCYL
jgi:3-dehydroquinate synthase